MTTFGTILAASILLWTARIMWRCQVVEADEWTEQDQTAFEAWADVKGER